MREISYILVYLGLEGLALVSWSFEGRAKDELSRGRVHRQLEMAESGGQQCTPRFGGTHCVLPCPAPCGT